MLVSIGYWFQKREIKLSNLLNISKLLKFKGFDFYSENKKLKLFFIDAIGQ